jgi:hypothetical protein
MAFCVVAQLGEDREDLSAVTAAERSSAGGGGVDVEARVGAQLDGGRVGDAATDPVSLKMILVVLNLMDAFAAGGAFEPGFLKKKKVQLNTICNWPEQAKLALSCVNVC